MLKRVGTQVAALAILGLMCGSAQAETLAPGTPLGGDYELGPSSPGKWGSPTLGTGATITYSFMATGVSTGEDGAGGTIIALADFMPVGFLEEIEAAFAAWSAVADLTFVEVADAGEAYNASGASGDIRLGGHDFDGPSGTLAHGYYPPNNGNTAAGDIHFDVDETWVIGFDGPGFDIFAVAAHEIGHAIGLAHSDVVGALMYPFYSEAFVGPQADDIAGARFLYGTGDAVVPEPSTFALLGIGLIGLIGYRRKTQQAA